MRVRTLDDLSPQFQMTSGDVSSSLHDTDFQYFHSKENFVITVPFEVKAQAAVVTAHLQASLLETGLTFSIVAETGETTVYGRFESPHRMETFAEVLPAGRYSIVLQEAGSGLDNICVHFSAAVLIEAEDAWSDYTSLMRKTSGCGFMDLPKSLNLIGELEEGQLHWSRRIPLDVVNEGHRFGFILDKPSVLRLFIPAVPDVAFVARIFHIVKSPYKMIASKDPTKGLHMKLDAGSYLLDIGYGSDSELPQADECQTFSIDLQIVPEEVYTQLSTANSCSTSSPFPGQLKKPGETKALYYTDSPIDAKMKVDLPNSSALRVQLTYESALTGPLTLQLLDSQGVRVATSVGVQDFSSLSEAVPSGSYTLRVVGTTEGSELPPACAKLTLWYSTEETELIAADSCEGADLPEKLYLEEAKPFGGPQEKDGSISFYGVFRIPEDRSSDKVLLRVGENCIARVLTVTAMPGMSIETMLYQDLKMTNSVGFSKNAGRASSFILALDAKYEPYVLEVTYSKHKRQSPCSSFELAIEIEKKTTVLDKLTCDQALVSRALLPDMRTSLSGKETKGGESFTIRGAWLVGDPKTFPQGITSSGKKNSPFSYQMQLDIVSAGRFSASATFDFLTNDIYLQLLKGEKVLSKSQWEVLGESLGEDLELSSTLEDAQVEAGVYTLVLRQAVAANHLVQMFSDSQLCFPFAFSIEFDGEKTEEDLAEEARTNKLVDVVPADKANINPSKGLAIIVTWEKPVMKGKKGSFVKSFFLESDKKVKVHPSSVRQEKAKPQKVEMTFKPGQLGLGTCYSLRFSVEELDLGPDDPQPQFDFNGAHSYCTGNCACNPKAEAKCSSEMECICPSPYAGVTCEECVEGYTFEETSKVCTVDECASCPGACVNGKCQSPTCECGDFGECVKNRCKCQSGYTGDKCDLCSDEEFVYPDCTSCQYDSIPQDISYKEGKGKAGISRKGEFTFSAERVEKKLQSTTFKLAKASSLRVDITDSLKDTKVLLTDTTKKSYKPLTDDIDSGIRSLTWELQANRNYYLSFRGKQKKRCDSFALDMAISPSETVEQEPEEEPTEKPVQKPKKAETDPSEVVCQGHGRTKPDGTCTCDVGYIGSSCGKCDDGYEMRSPGLCVQKIHPAITVKPEPVVSISASQAPAESNWGTTLFGLAVCVVGFYALYRMYLAKNQGGERWRRREQNPSGFDGPDDEEEEERRGLQERSRMRRTQDPTL